MSQFSPNWEQPTPTMATLSRIPSPMSRKPRFAAQGSGLAFQ